MAPWQERVVTEKEALDARISRLTEFRRSDTHAALPQAERNLLLRQWAVMLQYRSILDERIAAFPA